MRQAKQLEGWLWETSTGFAKVVVKIRIVDPFVINARIRDSWQHIATVVGLYRAPNNCAQSDINLFQFRLSAIIFIAIYVDSVYTCTQTYALWTMSVISGFVDFVSKRCRINMSLYPSNLLEI